MKKIILSTIVFLSFVGFSQEKVTINNGRVTVSKTLSDIQTVATPGQVSFNQLNNLPLNPNAYKSPYLFNK